MMRLCLACMLWCAVAAAQIPVTGGGAAGGTGASTIGQLTDLQVTYTDSTHLAIGVTCLVATPCLVEMGSQIFSFTAASAQITAGTGTAYIYVDNAGTLTVASNLTVTCTNCTAAVGTSMPGDAYPLAVWTATSATWDSSGGINQRSVMYRAEYVAGTGVTFTASGNKTQINASGTGTVTSITLAGTANQVTVIGTCTVTTTGTCTFSIPSAFQIPGTINKLTLTQPATGATLTIADGKTLTANSSVIFTGTDGSTLTFGTGGTLTYTSNNLSVFAATTSAQLAGVISDETGTGALVFAGSPALTGVPTAPTAAASDNSTELATTAYVTTGIANAINAAAGRDLVKAATAAVLPNTPTYSNGVSGIGATLTSASNTALVVDGYTCVITDRILVKNQASSLQNGIYYCSQVGTGILPWILTRALDYDVPSDINNTIVPVANNGTVNPLTSWIQTATVATVGTDAITFAAFTPNGANIVTASSPGAGLCHFAGATQACTSSAVVNADIANGTIDLSTKALVPPAFRLQGNCSGASGNGTNQVSLDALGGSVASGACAGNATYYFGTPIQTACTLQNLTVNVGIASVTGGDGVVIVYDSDSAGSGPTSTGLTVTMGTTNTQSDNTHTYAIAKGHYAWIKVNTNSTGGTHWSAALECR